MRRSHDDVDDDEDDDDDDDDDDKCKFCNFLYPRTYYRNRKANELGDCNCE